MRHVLAAGRRVLVQDLEEYEERDMDYFGQID
jgi:hypothetical protein